MKEKLTEAEYKDLSEKFSKVWLEKRDIEQTEKDFMEAMNDLVWWATQEPDGTELRLSCYNFPLFLEKVQEAIKQFQEVYHIVHVTSGWKDDKDK